MTIEEALACCMENHFHLHFSAYPIPSTDSDFSGAISHSAPYVAVFSEEGRQIVPARCHHGWDENDITCAVIEAVEAAKKIEEGE